MRSRLLLALPLITLAAIACSSSSGGGGNGPTPCNENPWSCPSGQVCWPKDGSSFGCFNAGPGKLGDPCMALVGMPTCGAGLDCLQLTTAGGTCVAYCSETDTSHACPSGAQCTTAYLGSAGGAQFSVCVVTSMPQDGGGDTGSSSSSGSGSSSGSSSSSGSGSGSSSGSGDASSSSSGGGDASAD